MTKKKMKQTEGAYKRKNNRKKVRKEADIRYREYWRDNERFADLFNTVVFGGESRICPEELGEMDTRISKLIPTSDLERGVDRTRDIMKVSKGVRYLLLGVENQKHIHYGMPLRTLTYDVLGYIDEANHISEKRRKEKGLTSAEFLSGMRKEDKLTPIITIVIYYGEEPWDGPLTLSEMFHDDVQKSGLNQTEHRVILLQVSKSEQYHFGNKDTETIFSISRELFRGNVTKVKEKYNSRDLSQELIAMIGTITGFRGMEQVAERGEKNMCKAIDALFEQERIKTEERMCKGIQEALEKERREVEERMTLEKEDALKKVRRETEEKKKREIEDALKKVRRETEEKKKREIEDALKKVRREEIVSFVELLKEFQCETKEICRRLKVKYNLSDAEVKAYIAI